MFLFSSLSFSQTWDTSSVGLSSVNPTSILKYQYLTYLTTNSDGMYYSSNDGLRWFPFYTWSGLNTSFFSCVIEKDGNLYAGSQDKGIFKSTNLGYSWRNSDTGITVKKIRGLVSFNNKLFAATFGGGIFISTNDGLNWYQSNNGLENLNLYKLKIYSSNLYTSTSYCSYVSTDQGVSWTKFFDSNNKSIRDYCVKNNILFVSVWNDGLYRSTNNGINWSVVGLDSLGTVIKAVHLHNNILFANNYHTGIYRSFDDGITWTRCSHRLGNSNISRMFTCNNELYAGADYSGLYKSSNCGNEWISLNNNFLPFRHRVSVLRSQDNVIMGGKNWSVAVSTNNGASWYSSINHQQYLSDLLLDSNRAFAVGHEGLSYSTNYGITWHKSPFNATAGFFNVICKKGNAIYIGNRDSVLYKSTDFGNTFTPILTTGLPIDYFTSLRSKGQYLFAGLYNHGIYRSADGGLNWAELTNGLPYIRYTKIFVSDSAIFTYGHYTDFLYRSTDNGNSWHSYIQGNIPYLSVTYFYASEPYALLNSHKCYKTTNNGLNWIILPELGTNNLGEFVISNNYAIFASTTTIMRSKLFNLTGTNNNFSELNNNYHLYQNYPNPFNAATSINFSIPKVSIVNISIYDITGKIVRNLVNEEFNAGTHSILFFAGDLSSGIYFYRIITEGYSNTKKLILIK